jgi:serine/threonine-protein kinase
VKIGRYEVEIEIGRGAMGVVYLAVDPRLERRVAIKTYGLPEGLPVDQKREFQERFLREARAAACLSNPAIVTVFDCAEDEETGNPFIAMEYVAGRTLRDWMDSDGRLPADRAVEIAGILAEALHAAHEAGIVHRDVKPGNVLVSADNQEIKITDFGVARLRTSELTRTGMTLGSPAYMSPEQVTRGDVDARSDLFSLAVILYEMLVGERPFNGDELAGLAYSIVHEHPIPATKKTPGLPRAWDEFFERALAKNPAERFVDGREFSAALLRAADPATDAGFVSTVVEELPIELAASPISELPTESTAPPPPSSSPPPACASGADNLTPTAPISLPREEDEGAPRPGTYPADEDQAASWVDHERVAAPRRWLVGLALVPLVACVYWIWGGGTSVELEGKSSVRSGTLTLTVDGRNVYTRELAAESPGGVRILKKAIGIKEESFNTSIDMAPGTHEIVALLESDDGDTQHQRRVVVDLGRGENRRLRLSAGGAYGAPLSLKLD